MQALKQILSRHQHFAALLLICLISAGIVAGNYGEAADDESLDLYARQTFDVYVQLLRHGTFTEPDYDILGNYGPAFLLLIRSGQLVAGVLAPNLNWFTVWHFVNFIGYLVGIIAFYVILLQFFKRSVALSTTLLFASQPVLWGQGFLNAKDSPLMAFSLLAIALGIRLVKLFPVSSWDLNGWSKTVRKDLQKVPQRIRQTWLQLLVGLGAVLLSVFFWESGLTTLFSWLFSADPASWLGQQVRVLAPHADNMPITGYVGRALNLLTPSIFLVWGLILLGLIIASMRKMPNTRTQLGAYLQFGLWQKSSRFWKSGLLWAAAFALAFATAIRVTGPFAAILVVLYLLITRGPSIIAMLPAYGLLSGIFVYILWPFLWPDPIGNFLEAIRLMSDFPWSGHVLFNGEVIRATKLPASYLPTLLGIQFTLPALFFFLTGLFAAMWPKNRSLCGLLVLALVWLLLPLGYVVWKQPTLYHNFRQLLFIIPAIFFLAAYGLDWLQKIAKRQLFTALVILALLPGLVAIIELHPYEYVYYNELVGGVRGAEGRYELEYWGSSLTHAMLELNKTAPPGALVVSWGNAQIPSRVARPDLRVEQVGYHNYDPERKYDYGLVPLRAGRERDFFQGYPEILIVHRLGIPFTVVNQLNCNCPGHPRPIP